MASESVFRGALEFFYELGVYDVILPFLLVFAMVFAILEKTKVFGTEKIGNEEFTKKNINSLVAFVVSFLVIASSKLVEIIIKISSQMVVILVGLVFFLLLIGTFYKKDEEVALENGMRTFFIILVFVSLSIMFLDALTTASGQTWLSWLWEQVTENYNSRAVSSLILMALVVGFMFYLTKDDKKPKGGDN